jgi:hypothetical protein
MKAVAYGRKKVPPAIKWDITINAATTPSRRFKSYNVAVFSELGNYRYLHGAQLYVFRD